MSDAEALDEAPDSVRFWSKVVKGPRPSDCWIWTGAIGDDGYGRYWQRVPGGQRMWRAHRFAVTLVFGGGELSEHETVRHQSCDVPLCVHAALGADSHLILGSVAENNLDRSRAGRHANMHSLRRSGGRRRDQVTASRELRDHLLTHGWDAAFPTLLAGYSIDQEQLF
ncbi:hypothetical protein [Sinomonas humi]|uniref:hypothetical protein n=1 Tax=Sinomonas humi TaxID=1338436 RepID=UPI0009DFE6B9|nr:hypothetical protein [Sinomonas humi]